MAIAASLLQSGDLLALAVRVRVALSRPLGLAAPVFEAVLSATGAVHAFRRQLLPAAIACAIVASLLVYLTGAAPAELRGVGAQFQIPIAPKLLYGGVTEEIRMRWGFMSVLIWLPWRYLQCREGSPGAVCVAAGIVVSALLFGLGHLPAVAAMGGELRAPVVAYVLVGDT